MTKLNAMTDEDKSPSKFRKDLQKEIANTLPQFSKFAISFGVVSTFSTPLNTRFISLNTQFEFYKTFDPATITITQKSTQTEIKNNLAIQRPSTKRHRRFKRDSNPNNSNREEIKKSTY